MIDWDCLVGRPTVGVFGEPFTYTDETNAQQCSIGVFDAAYHAVQTIGGDMVADIWTTAAMPVLGVQVCAMPTQPFQGMNLTIRGQVYCVKEVQDDGHGHAKLLLNLGSYEP